VATNPEGQAAIAAHLVDWRAMARAMFPDAAAALEAVR
jgi:hypothetical protein